MAIAVSIVLIAYVAVEVFESQQPGASITGTVTSWGYGGVFSLMVLEASSMPIPSEIVLPFAGYLVSTGNIEFTCTLAVATIGALVGSLIDYYIGLKGVETLAKYKLLGRSIFSEHQLKVAANYFDRYGSAMVFAGRLVPVLRTLISFPAGAVKMPLAKFLGYTLAGCLIWNSLLIYVGYYLGGNWHEVANYSHYIVIAVAACIVAVMGYFFHRRYNRRKSSSRNIVF